VHLKANGAHPMLWRVIALNLSHAGTKLRGRVLRIRLASGGAG
jgi:hypothetical protein